MSHTEAAIGEALTRLAVARGGLVDDTASEVYLDRLVRFDVGLVRRACEQWSDVPRKDYETTLPAVGLLIDTIRQIERQDAAREAAKKLLPLPKTEDEEPRFFCLDCRDESSGWRPFWCAGTGPARAIEQPGRHERIGRRPCDRLKAHTSHSYVEKCGCYATNPIVANRRDREQKRVG